jgi:hypothetical protein
MSIVHRIEWCLFSIVALEELVGIENNSYEIILINVFMTQHIIDLKQEDALKCFT